MYEMRELTYDVQSEKMQEMELCYGEYFSYEDLPSLSWSRGPLETWWPSLHKNLLKARRSPGSN
jgi:hypothetical protein